jgi:transposase-like protein
MSTHSPNDRPERNQDQDGELECPYCESGDVVRDSQFGPEISKSQFYCNDCATPFERIKFGDANHPETGR